MSASVTTLSKLPRPAAAHDNYSSKLASNGDSSRSFGDALAQVQSPTINRDGNAIKPAAKPKPSKADTPNSDSKNDDCKAAADQATDTSPDTSETEENKVPADQPVAERPDSGSDPAAASKAVVVATQGAAQPMLPYPEEKFAEGESPGGAGTSPAAPAIKLPGKTDKSNADGQSASSDGRKKSDANAVQVKGQIPVEAAAKSQEDVPDAKVNAAPVTPPKSPDVRLQQRLQSKENQISADTTSPAPLQNDSLNTLSPVVDSQSKGEQAIVATANNKTTFEPMQSTSSKPAPAVVTSSVAPTTTDKSTSAESASAAQETPKNQHDSTFEQIVLGLRSKFDPQNGRAEIRLEPPTLGAVHVSINLQNGLLTAQLQSDSAPVQDLLRSHLDQLKKVLESQGVTVDKLVVNNIQDKAAIAMSSSALQTNADGRGSNGQTPDQRRSTQSNTDDEFTRIWNELNAGKKPLDLVA